ncbi:MAG: hypothetical protein AB1782_09070 [Cyanobacteriota bacterium]
MTYNYRCVVNNVLRKTEFGPVSETNDSEFNGINVEPIVDRIKDWTNEVYIEICNSGFWRFLETEASFSTVIGQQNYSVADNCQVNRIINVREIHTPSLLRRIDFKDIDKCYPDTLQTTSATPRYYYFLDNTIYLYPVPNSVITVKYRYYKMVSELINSTEVPEIPEQWKWVWVNGVLVRVNQYLQDQSLNTAQMHYYDGLLQMRAANRADIQRKNSINPY